MGLIRLTKANKNRDRLLIASDAICAIEECTDEKNTRVMTMDGFWYEVVDGIEKIEKVLLDFEQQQAPLKTIEEIYPPMPHKQSKKAYVKKHRVMSPAIDKPQERASESIPCEPKEDGCNGEG